MKKKTINSDTSSQRTHVYLNLPPEAEATLRVVAALNNVSVSEYVRRLLLANLEGYDKEREMVRSFMEGHR